MAYPKKIRESVLKLLTEEGLSPESLIDELSKNPKWNKDDIPSAKTIRNWLSLEKIKQQKEQPYETEVKRQHDIRVFTGSNAIMSEKDLHSFPFPVLMPGIDEEKAVWYVSYPSRPQKIALNDAVEVMHKYMEFFSYEGNKYFDSTLDSYSARLSEIIGQIASQLSIHPDILRSYESKIDQYREHMLTLKPVVIYKGEAGYHPHKRLAVRYSRAIEAYKNYRKVVREALLL